MIGIKSAYTLFFSDLTVWNYTGFVVIIVSQVFLKLVSLNMLWFFLCDDSVWAKLAHLNYSTGYIRETRNLSNGIKENMKISMNLSKRDPTFYIYTNKLLLQYNYLAMGFN